MQIEREQIERKACNWVSASTGWTMASVSSSQLFLLFPTFLLFYSIVLCLNLEISLFRSGTSFFRRSNSIGIVLRIHRRGGSAGQTIGPRFGRFDCPFQQLDHPPSVSPLLGLPIVFRSPSPCRTCLIRSLCLCVCVCVGVCGIIYSLILDPFKVEQLPGPGVDHAVERSD